MAGSVVANEIDLAGGERPSLALEIPKDQTFEAWETMGRKLSASSQVINWWIGDWWNAGKKFGEDRRQDSARQIWGVEADSARVFGWVADKFPDVTRVTGLPFRHHQEAAVLELQQALPLLRSAKLARWSTRELRRKVIVLRTEAIAQRRQEVIDIRPEREEGPSDDLSSAQIIIELANALSRERELTRRESGWLEMALYRDRGRGERVTEAWSAEEELRLVAMLREGKRPPEIATISGRSEYALWKRINLMGGVGRLLAESSAIEWPIRKEA